MITLCFRSYCQRCIRSVLDKRNVKLEHYISGDAPTNYKIIFARSQHLYFSSGKEYSLWPQQHAPYAKFPVNSAGCWVMSIRHKITTDSSQIFPRQPWVQLWDSPLRMWYCIDWGCKEWCGQVNTLRLVICYVVNCDSADGCHICFWGVLCSYHPGSQN